MSTRSGVPGPWSAAGAALPTDDGRGALICCICGQVVEGRPEPGLDPMCDACAMAREFDETLWEQDLADPDAGLW